MTQVTLLSGRAKDWRLDFTAVVCSDSHCVCFDFPIVLVVTLRISALRAESQRFKQADLVASALGYHTLLTLLR